MEIHNAVEVQACARRRLVDAGNAKRVAAIYAGLTLGMSALVVLVGMLLDLQVSKATGLRGMGTRTILVSVQNVLPILSALVALCLEVGYQAAMLRVARGQYVSPQTLRLGFDRLWTMVRCVVAQGLILFGIVFGGIYLSTMLFVLSPFSKGTVELLTPLLEEASKLNPQIVLDDGMYLQLMQSMIPAFVICAVVIGLVAIPTLFRWRMVHFIVIDRPGVGALAALRESRKMLKGNCGKLLKLDVSLWWYYGASFLAMLLCYGDLLLAMLGVSLPGNTTVVSLLFFAAYLAVQFAVYYYLRNPAETAYAIAYDAIRPKEPKTEGAVLGSIFQ